MRGNRKEQVYAVQHDDPVSQPFVTPASTNVNYRDEGTTGAYQGIICAIILLRNNYIVE